MKIRTAKDVEKLDKRLKNELGIDVSKYKNEEVVENFVELVLFPQYVITWVIRPLIIAIIIFVMGFFILNLVHIEFVLYAFIGFFLFFFNGILLGLLFLMWKMKTDIWGIVDYSLEIMKSAVSDLNHVSNQVTKENRKDVLGLVFKGVIHIVTIPMVTKIISEKVPFVGGLVNGLVKKILTLVSDKVMFDPATLDNELAKDMSESNAMQIYSSSISSVSGGLEKIMNFTFGVAQLPLKISFIILFLSLVLFVYIIN